MPDRVLLVRFCGVGSMVGENSALYGFSPLAAGSAAAFRLRAAADRLARYPLLSAMLSVASFAFLGPVAALILVATILDHEFAHRYMMRRLGYAPGPVKLLPIIGAYVRAGRPMLCSADIALIYLAGPVAGILSAESAAFVASKTLAAGIEQQVFIGAAVAIGLNLVNLLPYEPLDGGLISRALPYPALLLFPVGLAAWLFQAGLLATRGGGMTIAFAVVVAMHRVNKWRQYARGLRARMDEGDTVALQQWQLSFNVPLAIRILVACVYGLTIVGGAAMFVNVAAVAYQTVP